MEKLVVAKAIMDKTENIKRGDREVPMVDSLANFNAPPAKYNIPNEYMAESRQIVNTNTKVPTIDAIKNSKLPDEIKKLMIENPINPPQQTNNVTLSEDLVEKASRLMGRNEKPQEDDKETKINYKLIQKMIENSINNALQENGLLVESSDKSNEVFSFRVGKHIFEGKISKIKKLQ